MVLNALRGIVRFLNMSSTRRLSVFRKQVTGVRLLSSTPQCSYASSSVDTQSTKELLGKLMSSSNSDKEVAVYQFIRLYRNAQESSQVNLLNTLSKEYSTDPATVVSALDHLRAVSDARNDVSSYNKQLQKIKSSLVSPYEKIFRTISAYPGGVKFLVDLRKDVINFSRNSTDFAQLADLQAINQNLKEVNIICLLVINFH